jgi:hypothetical protein
MRFPTTEQIDVAIAWLRLNEGNHEESGRCAAVADYLEWLECERMLRYEARKAGVTAAQLRRKLAETKGTGK